MTLTSPTPPAPADEPMCRALLFESLFVHALKAHGALAEALRAEGFDPQQPRAHYPVRVLQRCVDVAAPHVLPHLARAQAQRELGRQLVRGLGHTLLGRVLLLVLPRMGPVRLLERYPDYARALQVPLAVHPRQLSERSFRLEHRELPQAAAEFAAGALEEALRVAGVEPTVHLERRAPGRFDAHVSW